VTPPPRGGVRTPRRTGHDDRRASGPRTSASNGRRASGGTGRTYAGADPYPRSADTPNRRLGTRPSRITSAPLELRSLEWLVAIAIEVLDRADRPAGRRPVLPHRPAQRHHGTGGDAPRQAQRPPYQSGAPQRQGDQRRAEPGRLGRQQYILHRGIDRPIVIGDHERWPHRPDATQTRHHHHGDLLEVLHLPLHRIKLTLHLRVARGQTPTEAAV
jgi:hypothetical protein